MKKIALSVLLVLIFSSLSMGAGFGQKYALEKGGVGRYQVITGPNITSLIVDTQNGRTWVLNKPDGEVQWEAVPYVANQ